MAAYNYYNSINYKGEKMKYQLTGNIYSDFEKYLANENLYHHFYGHKLSNAQYNKVTYIWKSLLKQKEKK